MSQADPHSPWSIGTSGDAHVGILTTTAPSPSSTFAPGPLELTKLASIIDLMPLGHHDNFSPRLRFVNLPRPALLLAPLALSVSLALSPAKAAEPAKTQPAKFTPKAKVASGEPSAKSPARSGPGKTIVFIEGAVRSDLGTLTEKETVGRLEEEIPMDVKAMGPMFTFGFLTQLFKNVRVGGAVGYGMNLKMVERPTPEQEENEDFEPQEVRFGQQITLDARVEFSPHLGDKFWLVVMPKGGISIIQVGEDLRVATDALEDSHNIRKPRMGVILGGDLGVRYQYNEWFGVRGTFGLAYWGQSYLKATRNGDAADSDRSLSSSASRMSWGLATEVSF